MLVQRLWTSVKPTLIQRLASARNCVRACEDTDDNDVAVIITIIIIVRKVETIQYISTFYYDQFVFYFLGLSVLCC